MADELDAYVPSMSQDEIERIIRWHDRAYARLTSNKQAMTVSCLGLQIAVPPGVFPPVDGDFLGAAVLKEARSDDRVLDMGTGSGINAILAAQKARQVVAVDINPTAIAAATDNAVQNAVGNRIAFAISDLYDNVDGTFDLIVFNPPFRWFKPRDAAEASITDENYRTLTRFMRETTDRLTPYGRVLIAFGTSGDMPYLRSLAQSNHYDAETLATQEVTEESHTVSYYVLRLTVGPSTATASAE